MATELSGNLDASELGYVSGHRVRLDLVPQTQAMVVAAARDGISLRITQAYRSYAEQVVIFKNRYTPTYLAGRPYRVWNGVRWYQRPGTSVAAVPGTSNHGWGQAIDFATDSPGAISWLAKNGAKFGWSRPAWTYVAGTVEPWHHEGVLVELASNPIGGGGGSLPDVDPTDPITPIDPLEEDDMNTLVNAGPAGLYLLDGGVLLPLDEAAAASVRATKHEVITISRDLYLTWLSRTQPLGVCLFNTDAPGIAMSFGGQPFVRVYEPVDYESLRAQGVAVISIQGGSFHEITGF